MNRREFLKKTAAVAVASTLLGCQTPLWKKRPQSKPNIVVLFTDDLGYGDLACYGHPTIKTPNIDKMARQGMKLTQFYSASSVCSPSRAALLTGRLPKRTTIEGVVWPNHKSGLPQTEITIARALKQSGYATGCIGKWHLGHRAPYLPTSHGFDSYYGIPYSNDMRIDPKAKLVAHMPNPENAAQDHANADRFKNKPYLPLMRDDKVVEFPADQANLTQQYTQEALRFIRQKSKQPFFLYLAYTKPHTPLYPSKPFQERSLRGLYGDVVEEIDDSVGQILTELQRQGLDENTLVIFTSDNGPWLSRKLRGGSSGLLRGGKSTTWEGGHRTPCIARWPGVVPPHSVNAGMTSTLDIFPTIMAFAGKNVPDDRVMDGHSLKNVLTDNAQSPRDTMYFYDSGVLCAVRWKHWKLHLEIKPDIGGRFSKPESPLLFNLDQDPSEKYDIAQQHPDVVAAIKEIIEKHNATMD